MHQGKTNISQITTLNKSLSTNSVNQYEQKLQSAYQMNIKLKELLQTIKNNNLKRKKEMSQKSQIIPEQIQLARLKKQEVKLQNQNQHLINNLNVLINQNAKLKAEVDSSRNSRVIYSNVYKNIEKQIKKLEFLYRLAIIDVLEYKEVQSKLQQKINKTVKQLEKEVNDLEGGASKKEKSEIKKTRLDTSITGRTGRQSSSRGQSIETSKDLKLITKRNDKAQQNSLSTSKAHNIAFKQDSVPSDSIQQTKRMNPILKSKTRISQFIPQIQQKLVQVDLHQNQMKSAYYDNIIKHLKQMSQLEDMKQIAYLWLHIDNDIQCEYKTYLEYQQKLKELDDKDVGLNKLTQAQSVKDLAVKTVEEEELQKILEEMEKQKALIEENERLLTEKIDINTHKLSDEDIHHHILRIKRKGQTNNRELQKLLENVRKQKNSVPKNMQSRLTQR